MRRLALFLVVAGCARAIAPRADVPTQPAPVSAAPPPASIASVAGPEAGPPACALTDADTIDDGEGALIATHEGPGSMVLDDVRVLASGADDTASTTVVTWTRRAHFPVGDSWRTPHMAIQHHPGTGAANATSGAPRPAASRAIGASGAVGATGSVGASGSVGTGATWKKTTLPVLGYACATYGTIAPNTVARPFVAWGVANTTAFELWKDIPSAKDPSGATWEYTAPLARVDTARSSVDHFVASRDVALAMATEETCDVSCTCIDPARYTIHVRSLDAKNKFSIRLAPPEAKYEDRADAPALAMSAAGGIAAYRYRKKLYLAWLDAAGRPNAPVTGGNAGSNPIVFAEGDVGAPAVAMAGADAVVVWSQRASKDEPYRLKMMRLERNTLPRAPQTRETPGSAYAPAVLADADGKSVIFSWMEGDGGTHGAIHVARGWTGPSTMVSGDETNARDPELSGTVAHPTIVWQTFPTEKRAGIIRVGRLDCEKN